jgi:hypothetical protein
MVDEGYNYNLLGVHDEYEDGMTPKYARIYNIGGHTTPQSANQLEDFSLRANAGIPNVELMTLSPEVFEAIPKEHLKEIGRIAKLTETNPSLHAPLLEPSGFTQQGWSEQQRRANEREIWNVVERSYELDDRGNVPVNIHGANIFGAEWEKDIEEEWKKKKEEPKEIEFKEKKMPRVMTVVNQETGQITPLEYEKKYYIEGEQTWHPLRRLESLNKTQWDQEQLKIMSFAKDKKDLSEKKEKIWGEITPLMTGEKEGVLSLEEQRVLRKRKEELGIIDNHIKELNNLIHTGVQDMHDKVERFHKEGDKNYEKYIKEIRPRVRANFKEIENQMNKIAREHDELVKKGEIRRAEEKIMDYHKLAERHGEVITNAIIEMPTPELWKPVNEVAIEKASETLSSVALRAFKKFGEKAPVINVENSYPQLALSRAEDLRKGIEETRIKLAEKLVKEERISKDKAKEIAEKLVGATWDIGHINMLRKGGYSEKEILEETKKIAPLVKHVHVTDNFGHHDIHLPPGMGNVPIKKMLEILEKQGASPEQLRHIVEAGGFIQHFKRSPWEASLRGLDSSLYRIEAQPTWSRVQELYAPYSLSYSMGYGEILPEHHFKTFYGAGWAGVPRELGGQTGGGERGRFAQGGATEEGYA